MKSVSSLFKQAAFAPETDQALLLCLTIDHADLAEPIRVVNDGVDLVRSAGTFLAYPFRIALPFDRDDELPRVVLSIDNVDRSIVLTVRSLSSPPSITLEAVLSDSPDTVEVSLPDFVLKSATYDKLTVEGELSFEDILNEPYPGGTFRPALFPGMF